MCHTRDRPIIVRDNMVFLYCSDIQFTPSSPYDTVFLVTHVWYVVRHIRNHVYYFDRIRILYKEVNIDPGYMRIQSSTPLTQHSIALSALLPTRTLQSVGHQPTYPRATLTDDYDNDSDNSQVKKKTKIAAVEWRGKAFYVTGKENALHILRATQSIRIMMVDDQLDKLVIQVGNYVNHFTSENFKLGIFRQQSKSALLAGMTLQVNADHDLHRYQQLACFNIKEIQEVLFINNMLSRIYEHLPVCSLSIT